MWVILCESTSIDTGRLGGQKSTCEFSVVGGDAKFILMAGLGMEREDKAGGQG